MLTARRNLNRTRRRIGNWAFRPVRMIFDRHRRLVCRSFKVSRGCEAGAAAELRRRRRCQPKLCYFLSLFRLYFWSMCAPEHRPATLALASAAARAPGLLHCKLLVLSAVDSGRGNRHCQLRCVRGAGIQPSRNRRGAGHAERLRLCT